MRFGMVVTPTDMPGTSDAGLYGELLGDAMLGHRLGFESAWFIEHHFTDYYPVPSPFVFMGHVAAHCPGMGLGTCVSVTPWHNPIRFAEEIAMLSILSSGHLHIGMGRGTASLEYEAMGIDMALSREIFAEGWEITRRFVDGESFAFDGRFTRIGREVHIRPRANRERITFYGALSSPGTATILGGLGLAPLCAAAFPLGLQTKTLGRWQAALDEAGATVTGTRPIMVNCFLADSDEAARELSRRYTPLYYRQQIDHYEIETTDWSKIRGYENYQQAFESFKRMSNPDNLGPWMDLQMIGTAETACRRIEEYRDAGFNKIIVHCATPGIPRAVRHDTLRRFARDVAPRFAAGPLQAAS